jgi:hypothetical protein
MVRPQRNYIFLLQKCYLQIFSQRTTIHQHTELQTRILEVCTECPKQNLDKTEKLPSLDISSAVLDMEREAT